MNIIPAIKTIEPWLTSKEMAVIALNGGYELTVRDRLLYPMQQQNPELRVRRERPYRVDLALLKGDKLRYFAEFKHNFKTQFGTGARAENRLQQDREKRSHLQVPSQYIHMVTTVLEGPCPYGGGKHWSARQIADHFSRMGANQVLSCTANTETPYQVVCQLDIYVLSTNL